MKQNHHSVRIRLTAWYTAALAVIILLFSIGVYAFVRSSLLKQLDHQLKEDLTAIEASLDGEPEEMKEIEQHSANYLFRVTEGKRVIYQTFGWGDAQLDKAMKDAHPDSYLTWISPEGKHYRIGTVAIYDMARNTARTYTIAVASNAGPVYNNLRILAITLAIGLPCVLGLAILGGYFLAGRALSPIDAMAIKARQITAECLSERLPVYNPRDEFGRLAMFFNDTLKRLQDSFDRLRSFTADASHELRTPLTALRSVGEVGLRGKNDLVSCRNVIGSMLEEVDRLTILVDNLLTLTRFDFNKTCLESGSLNLASLVNGVIECLGVLAEEKGQTLSVQIEQTIMVRANEVSLRQALINLLDNAIKYTPKNGCIRVVTKQNHKGEAIVEIIDNGPGIAHEHHNRIFGRFYRIEKGRSSQQGGTGLGLAIARRSIEVNGGRIELESEPDKGSTFRIILPVDKGGGAQ